MIVNNRPSSHNGVNSTSLNLHLILIALFCVMISAFSSCDKDNTNEKEDKILTHEDSLALGLIRENPSDADSTTTPQNPPTPPKETVAMIDGINYKLNEDNLTAKVVWKEGNYSGSITIPDVVHYNNNDYPVVAVGESAFWHSDLKKVVIKGNNLKTIETHAFAQSGLSGGINIPNSVIEIGWRAFWNCGLTSITLPNSLKTIGKEAFRASPLKELKFPDYLESIGEGAFYNCSIEDITLPATVKEIGPEAFAYCAFLKTIRCYAIDVPKAEYSSFPFRLQRWGEWYNNYISLYVPRQAMSLYRETDPWKHFSGIIAIEE